MGDTDHALELWERVRATNLDLVVPRLWLANVYVSLGELERARACVSEALAVSPGLTVERAARVLGRFDGVVTGREWKRRLVLARSSRTRCRCRADRSGRRRPA